VKKLFCALGVLGIVFLSALVAAYCYDSDGGINLYVKGTCNASNYTTKGTDYCNANFTLKEFYCVNNSTCASQQFNCSFGCTAGACLNATPSPRPNATVTPTPIPNSCTDTDGGKNYFLRGTVYGYRSYRNSTPYNYTDYCLTNRSLQEYFCMNTTPSFVNYSCPRTCFNGACTNATNVTQTGYAAAPPQQEQDAGSSMPVYVVAALAVIVVLGAGFWYFKRKK